MATATRQFGRRGQTNVPLVNTTTTSTGGTSRDSRSTPPRRYVLDVPTGRTVRKSRTPDDFTRTRVSSANDEQIEEISRSASRDYYYRDAPAESSTATVTRYLDDASIKQFIETTTTTNYTNTVAEDQEVQALTAQATPDVKNYPINVDANPELVVRPNTQRLTYKQDIAVRYLKPATPPPPGVKSVECFLFALVFLRLSADHHPRDPRPSSASRSAHHPSSTSAAPANAFARHHSRETAGSTEIRSDDDHQK